MLGESNLENVLECFGEFCGTGTWANKNLCQPWCPSFKTTQFAPAWCHSGLLPPGTMTWGHLMRKEILHPFKDGTGFYFGAVLEGEGIVAKFYSALLIGMVAA